MPTPAMKKGKITTMKKATSTMKKEENGAAISVADLEVPELQPVSSDDEEHPSADAAAGGDEEDFSDSEDQALVKSALQHRAPTGTDQHPDSKASLRNRVPKNKPTNRKDDLLSRGTVYVGHIPMGFFEPQMKLFFEQFGAVTRYKLARSLKNGRPKGYGFVEFELKEVAKIVAETMDKYLLYGRKLVVKLISEEEMKAKTAGGKKFWKNSGSKATFVPVGRKNLKKAREQGKVRKIPEGVVISKRQQKRAEAKLRKLAELKDCGIDVEQGCGQSVRENVEKLAKAKEMDIQQEEKTKTVEKKEKGQNLKKEVQKAAVPEKKAAVAVETKKAQKNKAVMKKKQAVAGKK
eukprot:g2189.t1